MNKITQIIYILLIGILVSCENSTEQKLKENTTAEIFSYFEKKPEFFTFSPDSFFTVIGKEGTEISIMPECLVHQDGSLPTGEITLELKECYSASDIIFNNLTTQTQNGLLETGGMIYLQAKADGKVLKVKEGKSIEIKFPKKGKMKKGMHLFKGKKNENYIFWDETPISNEAEITIVTDTIMNSEWNSSDTIYDENDSARLNYYLFNTPITWWLNCDKRLEGDDKTVLTVNIDTSIIPNIRILFPNLKVAAFPLYENGKLIFYNIPKGESATIIGFYKTEDKHYIYKKEITVTTNIKETAIFREVSLEELKAEVEAIKWKESV